MEKCSSQLFPIPPVLLNPGQVGPAVLWESRRGHPCRDCSARKFGGSESDSWSCSLSVVSFGASCTLWVLWFPSLQNGGSSWGSNQMLFIECRCSKRCQVRPFGFFCEKQGEEVTRAWTWESQVQVLILLKSRDALIKWQIFESHIGRTVLSMLTLWWLWEN